MHHTHTNILGKDRDIGYGILRMSEDQPWRPYYLGNPLYATLLATFFQYGVALHDLEIERDRGRRDHAGARSARWRRDLAEGPPPDAQGLRRCSRCSPARSLPFTLAGNADRQPGPQPVVLHDHLLRPLPRRRRRSSPRRRPPTRPAAQWYFRQLLGSANLTGGKLFHIMSGNLSHQIEHHLFPDLPAHRYAEISVEVREICERYGLPYNSRPAAQAVRQRRPQDLPAGAAEPHRAVGPAAARRRADAGARAGRVAPVVLAA